MKDVLSADMRCKNCQKKTQKSQVDMINIAENQLRLKKQEPKISIIEDLPVWNSMSKMI